jgi:hypothetical protein
MRRARVVPSLPVCLAAFTILKLALAVAGFARTWDWMRTHAQRTAERGDVDRAAVHDAEYRVAMAAALYPGHAACLERSLLLFWYLRRAGVSVAFRMGVQMYPFGAHAWVEHEGVAINDVPEHVRLFRPIEGVAT